MSSIDRAVVLVNDGTCSKKLLGMTLLERAVKTARREGAKEILLITREKLVEGPDITTAGPTDKGAIGEWFKRPGTVMILSDNVVLKDRENGWTVGDGVFTVCEASEFHEGLLDGQPLDRLVGKRTRLPKKTLPEVEKALLRSMIKESDGYIARYFDRNISLAISRLLVRTPVTPNLISLVTIAIGVTGAWLISWGTYWGGVAGSALFVLSAVIDGCDGEVARLKFLQSKFGFLLDTIGDNVVYLSVMGAITYSSYKAFPDTNYFLLFGLLAGGIAITTTIIFAVVHRTKNTALLTNLERFANGDFSYIVLGFAVAGHLEYFLWAAAYGVHAFWIILLIAALAGRRG